MWLAIPMLSSSGIGEAVAMRIADMFSRDVPWAQKLWRSGPIEGLRHCAALVDSGGREKTKSAAVQQVRSSIERDLFIPPRDRGGMLKSLTFQIEKLVPDSVSYSRLQAAEQDVSRHYWQWLLDYLAAIDETKPVRTSGIDGDRLSWQIAAHLRAVGLSDRWIVNHCNYYLKYSKDTHTLSDMLESAKLASEGGVGWTFLIPLTRRSRVDSKSGSPWLTKTEFSQRFESDFPGEVAPEHVGGLEFKPQTIDKYAALEIVERDLAAALARNRAAGAKRNVEPALEAWVTPGKFRTVISLSPLPRVQFPALDAEGGSRLFETLSDELEAALDLLIAGDRTSARSATIAAWAVLETLFADESDYGELAAVADRAADILTCLYVRDAFLALATGHSRSGSDDLADELRGATVAAKAKSIEQAIRSQNLSVSSTLGQLAEQRARDLTISEIKIVRSQITTALRRLYDVRNQIVHAGTVEPHGLHLIYADSSVLLSALVNEVVLHFRESQVTAKHLAGRASWMITQVIEGRELPSHLAEL